MSPLQQIVIWRVKFFGGSSKHTFQGDFCRPPLRSALWSK
jgi:hypothetical protein